MAKLSELRDEVKALLDEFIEDEMCNREPRCLTFEMEVFQCFSGDVTHPCRFRIGHDVKYIISRTTTTTTRYRGDLSCACYWMLSRVPKSTTLAEKAY